MKIERISENQIRCTLSRGDLAERQIELSELAYGSEKARRLFHELIQTAAAEVGFDVENAPVMVEAVPLNADSIMLIVTRVEDPDELDTRFSRFSPYAEEDWADGDDTSDLATGLLEGGGEVRETSQTGLSGNDVPKKDALPDAPDFRLFAFDSLDAVITAARAVRGLILVHSTLYKDPAEGFFYLCIHSAGHPDAFRRICNTLSEYGTLLRSRAGVLAYCEEHYEAVIAMRALDKLGALS